MPCTAPNRCEDCAYRAFSHRATVSGDAVWAGRFAGPVTVGRPRSPGRGSRHRPGSARSGSDAAVLRCPRCGRWPGHASGRGRGAPHHGAVDATRRGRWGSRCMSVVHRREPLLGTATAGDGDLRRPIRGGGSHSRRTHRWSTRRASELSRTCAVSGLRWVAGTCRHGYDVLVCFDRSGISDGPTEAINGCLEYVRGSARRSASSPTTSPDHSSKPAGFRPHIHPRCDQPVWGFAGLAILLCSFQAVGADHGLGDGVPCVVAGDDPEGY